MSISPDAVEVRAIVRRIFLELGVGEAALGDLSENVLIDDGRIQARSYRIDQFMAMWMIEVGIVQFYDDAGNMVRRTNLLAEIRPRRMAA